MARTFPRGLSNLLARNVGIATHSTLELRIPSEITANQNYYFATAKLEIDGVTYDRQLRETGNVRTSLPTRSIETARYRRGAPTNGIPLAAASQVAFEGGPCRMVRALVGWRAEALLPARPAAWRRHP